MSFWNDFWDWFGFGHHDTQSGPHDDNCTNPANGLPMVGGCSGVDVEGNPYGTDSHTWGHSPEDMGWQSDNWSSIDSGIDSSWND